MSTTTPADIACWLRAIADLLERSTPAPLTVSLSLDVSRYQTTLSETERVVAVGGIAAALGMTAHPTKVVSYWEHTAERSDGPHLLSVSTSIEGPQLCACGATCTHGGPSAAA
jgi:hypothetical protein